MPSGKQHKAPILTRRTAKGARKKHTRPKPRQYWVDNDFRRHCSRSGLEAAAANAALMSAVFFPLVSMIPTIRNAIKQLGDQELDRLLAAVLAEQKRRGKKLRVSDENSRKRKVEKIAVPLTQGKLNAVRAAFKAGVTPSRIARQFGISQSDVRKALVGDG